MNKWVFVDGRGVLFEVAERHERARKALPEGAQVEEPALRAALAVADAAMRGLNELHSEKDERDYWVAYWRIFLRDLGLSESYAPVMHREAFWPTHSPVYPEVASVFGHLHDAGYHIGLITNGPPSVTLGLSQMGLLYFLDNVTAASEVGCRKPDPRIYRIAMGVAGVDPANAWFVDDDLPHVEAARAVGMNGVLLDRTGSKGDITTLRDLLSLLK